MRSSTVRVLVALAIFGLASAAFAQNVEMTFYGNQHFKFVTPGGKTVLINPWVKGNPDWPQDLKLEELKKVDVIFVSGGHGDDMGNADEIAKQSGAIVTPAELGTYFQLAGVPPAQIFGSGAGGQGEIAGIKYQIVHTHHGTGYTVPPQLPDTTGASTVATS